MNMITYFNDLVIKNFNSYLKNILIPLIIPIKTVILLTIIIL